MASVPSSPLAIVLQSVRSWAGQEPPQITPEHVQVLQRFVNLAKGVAVGCSYALVGLASCVEMAVRAIFIGVIASYQHWTGSNLRSRIEEMYALLVDAGTVAARSSFLFYSHILGGGGDVNSDFVDVTVRRLGDSLKDRLIGRFLR